MLKIYIYGWKKIKIVYLAPQIAQNHCKNTIVRILGSNGTLPSKIMVFLQEPEFCLVGILGGFRIPESFVVICQNSNRTHCNFAKCIFFIHKNITTFIFS